MARLARHNIIIENGVYYIVQKGNNDENLFCSEKDYQKFIDLLKNYKHYFGFLLFSFVLLPKQIVLLIEVKENNLSKIMHRLNTSYALYFNRRQKRKGHLFHGRYQSYLIEKKSFLLNLSRQIHLLPFKFGINNSIENYKWGTLFYYLNGNNHDCFVDTREILSFFKGKIKDRQEAYRSYINLGQKVNSEEPSLAGRHKNICGDSDFISLVKEKVAQLRRRKKIKKSLQFINKFFRHFSFSNRKSFPRLKKIKRFVSREKFKYFLLNRSREAAADRQMLMYIMDKYFSFSLKEIAQHLQYTSCSMISYGIRKFEKALSGREDLKRKLRYILKRLKTKDN